MASIVDERGLDACLARLEAARTWSPRVVSRLEAMVREGDDALLFRINPFTLARERDIDPSEAELRGRLSFEKVDAASPLA